MKDELHILKTYVNLVVVNASLYQSKNISEEIEAECERLKDLLFTFFNQLDETQRLKDVINWYRFKIIELADSLWEAAKLNNAAAHTALLIIVAFIQHTEQQYGCYLNNMQRLPVYQVLQLNDEIALKTEEIKDLLEQKDIAAPLLKQVIKAPQDLFKEGKYPPFCYAERQYLYIFLPQLKLFANDNGDKNWNRRLTQLLVKYNFNHMGIYNLLEEEHTNYIFASRWPEKQLRLLYSTMLWLEQIQVIPGLAYNILADSLKTMLLKHLALLKIHLKERMDFASPVPVIKFQRNLNVNELSLDFHYRFYEKEFGYKTKKEAAIAFSKNNSSKDAINISAHSINKFDKLELQNAAIKLYQKYKRMIAQLGKDFDLKFW